MGYFTTQEDCFLNCGHAFKMLLFSSAYLQLLPAMCLGSIVQLTNSVRAYMACACCFSLLALLFARRVVYSHADLQCWSSLHQEHEPTQESCAGNSGSWVFSCGGTQSILQVFIDIQGYKAVTEESCCHFKIIPHAKCSVFLIQ